MKRIIVVSLLVLASPFMVNVDNNQAVSSSAPMVAYAGRTNVGGYACTCGCPDCICDPGETPLNCGGTNSATVAGGGDSITSKGSIDSGSSVILLAFALLILFRLGSK